MSAKRKHRTTNEYLKYLKGELSREERHSFERDLEADPFEMDAMEGMEKPTAGAVEEDLLSLHATLLKRLKRRRRRTIYSIAATVASILVVGTIFLNIYQLNPDAAKESSSGDETFLHEEPATQGAAMEEEEKFFEQQAPEEVKVPVIEKALVQEEAPVREEIVVHEEKAMQLAPEKEEAETERALAKKTETEKPEYKEPVLQLEEERIAEAAPEEYDAPAPVADEVVAMEAQPQRSRKKGRVQKALTPYSTERVSGIVVSSEDMEPLPGASIMVKGSDSGMVADMEGRFTVVADQQSQTTVIASYVGMETGEYQLAGGTENRVVMQPDMATLDEVVVVGYGVEKDVYATGAVQKVQFDKEEFNYSGAEPSGGIEAFKMYMEENIRFPAGDTISKREVVVLKFIVESDGTLSEIKTLRSPGDPFTKVAIRLLKEGPVWNPARDESGATDDAVRMRIVFKR